MIIYEELGLGGKKTLQILFILASVFAAAFLAALTLYYGSRALNEINAYSDDTKFMITASGESSVFVVPNIAMVNLTVRSSGQSLQAVTASNSEKNNKIVAFLKSKGVDEKDIRTASYNVSPQYQYDRPCMPSSPSVICPPQSPPKIASYEVMNSLEVKVRSVDKVGEVLSGAVAAGANEISGPKFTIDDEDKYKEEARARAIAKAKSAAQKLVGDLHVRILRIKDFSESGGGPIYYATAARDTLGRGGAAEALPPSVEPGQNEVKVSVNITYEVR